ncbi:MAG: acylphosphatase [Planctomycetota bacterium]
MTGNTAKHIIFSGRVQGVGFRFIAHSIANRYRLAGFVRNQRDGTVEMVVQGTSEAIDECIADIKENFSGYIRETRIEEAPIESQYKEFKITF